MSTTHGQPGLSSDQRSNIRSTILSTRRTLEDELRRQLEKYGIYTDKKLPQDELTHLSAEELYTRDRIDAAIERELESTEGDLERSITNYVREATKTYLNRFVALKTIEVRGLVEETITERPEYGNRSYMHHTVAEIAGELTNAPDDGFGAALDLAYQEIGAEIRMIFEESEHTAIDLDAQVREEALDDLDAIDDEAWESDEALGWVYQYFGEEEREDIDERVDEENYKITGTDIATKTQLFTPRYIVEWMVDNSLGRTWLEMQGEQTNVDGEENCFYLAPLEDSLIDRETKSVEDITVLDPACGSGHILFYAFDVLYQMYLEEGEIPEEYIPREILRNNLYGIDIDSGAAQIAALSLYLKAKEESPEVTIPKVNVVSADAVLVNGGNKTELLDRARSDLEKKIFDQLWRSFDNIREFGSLVRVEERIDEILEEYRNLIEGSDQVTFTEGGSFATEDKFVSGTGEEETWQQVKDRLVQQVSIFAAEALEQSDPVEEMFAGEVGKTVELLDVLVREYDVVISNPPYLSSSKMDDNLKDFLKDSFSGYRDSYACFIERCAELCVIDGYATLVTPHDFMTQYSFRKFRNQLLTNYQIIEGAHLAGFSFSMKDRPFTIPFTIRKKDPDESVPSRFFRLTHEQDEYDSHQKTIDGLNNIQTSVRNNTNHQDIYIFNQNSFDNIDRKPFVYWFGDDILQLFIDHPTIESLFDIKQGLCTGDDDKFIRSWWEVPKSDIGEKYSWIVMGGDDSKYHYSPEKVVEWQYNKETMEQTAGSRLQNTEYYQMEGINYRDFSKYFTPREHKKSDIFNQTTRFIPISEGKSDMLGYLSTSLVRYIMDGLGSELHYTVGDGKRVPIKSDIYSKSDAAKLVNKAVETQRTIDTHNETSREFDPGTLMGGWREMLLEEDLLRSDIEVIHGLIDQITFEEYSIKEQTQVHLYNDLPSNLSKLPHIQNSGQLDVNRQEFRGNIDTEKVSDKEYQNIIHHIEEIESADIREISEELTISPYTVALARYKENLYTNNEKEEAAGRLVSFYIGCVLGRWDIDGCEFNSDGIASLDDELVGDIRECIANASNDSITESKLRQGLGSDIEDWVRHEFFRNYHTNEYTRRGQRIPIYWQLESPHGAFSCFIYYHNIDDNTLPKLRGKYLDPRINELENELEGLNNQTDSNNPDKELLDRKEEVQNNLDDIKQFRETIDKMIDDGVSVDVEKGIWENIKEWDQYEVLETGLPKLKSSYSR